MRKSLIRAQLDSAGAQFAERHGVEIVRSFGDPLSECVAVRNAAALADHSSVRMFTLPQEQGVDFLDTLLAADVPKLRFGRVLHTFLADGNGLLVADCLVANNDQELVLICESIVGDAELDALLGMGGSSPLKDLTADHVVLSLDGFKSWEIARRLFGADIVGLPFLSIENYQFAGEAVRLLRVGKTSEFGYVIIISEKGATGLFDALKQEVEKEGGCLAGVEAHDALRLEGRFFNIFQEGARVRDPLPLGLQWMISFEKQDFSGCAAIKARRAAGLKRKIIGLAGERDGETMREGGLLFHEGQAVAKIVANAFSCVLRRPLALADFPLELAYSGLPFRLGSVDGPTVKSISMPPIMPKSLRVKLDEM